MSGFAADWLFLREAEDARARDAALLTDLSFSCSKVLRVVDLGAGSGNNLRYLAPRLPVPQHWTLIDDDEATLSLRPAGKKLAIELDRRQLVQSASSYYEPIAALATSVMPSDEPVLLLVSHRLGRLPGLVEKLSRDVSDNLVLLPPEAAAAGALAYDKRGPSTPENEDSLTFLTSLNLGDGGKPFEADPIFRATSNDVRSPTHLLHDALAHPLDPEPFLLGVSIPEGKRGLNLAGDTAGISRYHCSIYRMNGRIVVEDHSKFGSFVNGTRVHERATLAVGDRLRLGTPGIEVQLIEVAD